MELDALKEAADLFAAQNAALVLIAPQRVEHNRAVAQEKNLPFQILSDPGNEVAARYGLRFRLPEDLQALYVKFGIDLEKFNGDDTWTLPLPARFIIDPEGMIRHADIRVDYMVRPDPDETLDALREIQAGECRKRLDC
jgi:peroxiredoxin